MPLALFRVELHDARSFRHCYVKASCAFDAQLAIECQLKNSLHEIHVGRAWKLVTARPV